MLISEEQQNQIQSTVDGRPRGRAVLCPVCSNSEWVGGATVLGITELWPASQEAIQVTPVQTVTCVKCGYVYLRNAKMIGLEVAAPQMPQQVDTVAAPTGNIPLAPVKKTTSKGGRKVAVKRGKKK